MVAASRLYKKNRVGIVSYPGSGIRFILQVGLKWYIIKFFLLVSIIIIIIYGVLYYLDLRRRKRRGSYGGWMYVSCGCVYNTNNKAVDLVKIRWRGVVR